MKEYLIKMTTYVNVNAEDFSDAIKKSIIKTKKDLNERKARDIFKFTCYK